MKELQELALSNRNKYANFPRQKRMSRVDYQARYWLYYAQIFLNNAWTAVLWKIAPKFGWKRRPSTVRAAKSADGRCLSYREWALLLNVDYVKLANLLDKNVELEEAARLLADTSFVSKVNLFVPAVQGV